MDKRGRTECRKSWLDALRVRWVLRALPFIVAVGACQAAADTDLDLHHYWDTRCKDCHGHAGAFARRSLRVQDGRLLGAHHEQNLDLFLQHHYLTADLVGPVKRMLAAHVVTPPLFARHCTVCHSSAAEFARKSLALHGNVPIGRRSDRPVAEYLQSHGGLTPDQIAAVVESLKRVLVEIGPDRDSR